MLVGRCGSKPPLDTEHTAPCLQSDCVCVYTVSQGAQLTATGGALVALCTPVLLDCRGRCENRQRGSRAPCSHHSELHCISHIGRSSSPSSPPLCPPSVASVATASTSTVCLPPSAALHAAHTPACVAVAVAAALWLCAAASSNRATSW
jgi:hypothetical protein